MLEDAPLTRGVFFAGAVATICPNWPALPPQSRCTVIFMGSPSWPIFALPIFALVLSGLVCAQAQHRPSVWEPSGGHAQVPIWPGVIPDATANPKPESLGPPPDREWWPRVNDVSQPTMTMYAAKGRNTGVAVVVFPGGGYQFLAMDLEGTEICEWLTSRGITCVLLKYRVPDSGPTMKDGRTFYPPVQTAVQDAQRTLGLVRLHAAEWHVDPRKVGVMGFSAGGHLAAAVSTRFTKRSYPPVDAADAMSCRPDFAVLVYPGHLWTPGTTLTLRSDIRVPANAPPTFLLHAQDDHIDPVKHSLTYYAELQKAGVPVEMHLYARGGHAFGVRPKHLPIDDWPALVEEWLHTIGMLTALSATPQGM
jgi:acetyl esterase/lipase